MRKMSFLRSGCPPNGIRRRNGLRTSGYLSFFVFLADRRIPGSAASRHPLIGNVGCLPRFKPREAQAWSGAGGHVGGEDVVRVAVQVLTGPVVPHSGARVGVTGGDLDVPEVDAGIEHGRHKRCGGAYEGAPWSPGSERPRRGGAGGGWPRAGPSGRRGG
jgi:hypothetical protein